MEDQVIENPVDGGLELVIENPVGRKRRKKTKKRKGTTSRKRRKSTPTRKRRRRTVSGASLGRRKRRKTTRRGAPVIKQAPKTSMVGKRRRKRYTRRGSPPRRYKKRRSLLGQAGMSLSGFLDDLKSIATITGGFLGLQMGANMLWKNLSTVKDSDKKPGVKAEPMLKPTVGNNILFHGGLFALAYAADNYFKPSGAFSNLLLGAKIASLFGVAKGLMTLFFGDKIKWDSSVTAIDTEVKKLLGASFLVDETGDVFPLGKPVLTMGKPTQPTIGDGDYTMNNMEKTQLDNQINQLMQGEGTGPFASMINAY